MIQHLTILAVLSMLAGVSVATDLSTEQHAIGASYQRLETAVLRLSDSLSETEPTRSAQLRDVVRSARNKQIVDRFSEVVSQLERQRLAAAARGQSDLVGQLDELLSLLSADPRVAMLEKRAAWARKLAAAIDSVERKQRGLRGESSAAGDRQRSADEQQELSEETELLAQEAENDPLGLPGAEGRPPTELLREASKRMRGAAQKLAGGESGKAKGDQSEAIEQLRAARRRLEETLRQIREEEQQRRLASLGERFREMVRRQESINKEVRLLHAESKALTRTVRRTLDDVAAQERGVLKMAMSSQRLIEAEDSSVVFAFAIEEVVSLLERAAERLEARLPDADVIAWQAEALGLLHDMVEAVDRDLSERRSSEGDSQPGNDSRGDRRLTGLISDLKMLRRLQAGVLKRSQSAEPPEARELARRQQRIAEATRAVLRQIP